MNWGIRKALTITVILAGLAMAGLASLGLLGGVDITVGMGPRLIALVALAGLGFGALWIALTVLDGHLFSLERLRADIVAADPEAPALPEQWLAEANTADEATRLAMGFSDFLDRQRSLRAVPASRLMAVVSTIEGGLVVVNATGLISLNNATAAALLGHDASAVGTSIFAALDRDHVNAAVAAAEAARRPIRTQIARIDGSAVLDARVTSLTGHGGAVLSFSCDPVDDHHVVHHDMALHDAPPEGVPVTDATRLTDLPGLVFDTETTGLDIANDRIVSIGAVRVHGDQVFPARVLDLLVNPQRSIPGKAISIHGITDAMVAGAPPFPAHMPTVNTWFEEKILIGHHIGFDLAMLNAECVRAGLPWHPPRTLDTGQLVSALEPRMEDLNLESIAARFGVGLRGRHTALGDALVTADIWRKLVPLLLNRGIVDLASAEQFAASAKRVANMESAAGW